MGASRYGFSAMTELIGERSVWSSTATLHALLEPSREGIVLVDADGTLLYANPAIGLVLGATANESVGRTFASLIHPDDQPAVTDLFAELLARGDGSASSVARWRCGDGSWHPLQATWTNQLHVPGIEAVVTRFSEIGPLPLPKQPFDLSTSRQFQVLIENAVHITAILEPEGTIRYVSPAVERMLGYSAASLIGMSASDIIHPEDVPTATDCFVNPGQP